MGFIDRIKKGLGFGKTIYVPDCTTKFKCPELYANYKKLIARTGIECLELDTHVCSGDVIIDSGFQDIFDEVRQKNLALFEKYNVTTIITNCPEAFKTFKEYYDIEVIHITQFLTKNMNTIGTMQGLGEIYFHDACSLPRQSMLTLEPRSILEHRGYTVKELPHHKEYTLSCGGYLLDHQPGIAKACAKQCIPPTVTSLVVASPRCYLHLKATLEGVDVKELSEVLV